jgi:hypothetical protein
MSTDQTPAPRSYPAWLWWLVGAAVFVLATGAAYGLWEMGRISDLETRLEVAESRLADETSTEATTSDKVDSEETDTSALAETSEKDPTDETSEPPSGPGTDDRVFGLVQAFHDPGGGTFEEIQIAVDRWEFLTGAAALAYLESVGDEDFYLEDYWYAKDTPSSIVTLKTDPDVVDVIGYTFPDSPPASPYYGTAPEQPVPFGLFYDSFVMNAEDPPWDDRFYWFEIEDGWVTVIEEQPRDPYYEP